MRIFLRVFLFSLALGGRLAAAETSPTFDILIRNGTVVDGSGQQRFKADIGIVGDTIAAIGRLDTARATRVIDARGKIVTPGFIDMHFHGDDDQYGPRGLRSTDPKRRAAQNYVTQGVTTGVVNPDGRQMPSLTAQRAELNKLGIGVNAVLLNGHNSLRAATMGEDQKRPASVAETAAMAELLRRGMEEEGSFGLSLGTEYFSGRYSSTEEQIALGRVLASRNGIFIPHFRSQGIAPMWYRPSENPGQPPATLADAVAEVLRVGRESGCTVVFTHMKAWGPGYRGEAAKWVGELQAARDEGVRVYMDVYPYDSSGSDGSFVALPPWALGVKAFSEDEVATTDFTVGLRRTLETPGKDAPMKADIENQVALKGGPENIRVLEYPKAAYVGRSLAEIMTERKQGLIDTVVALQLEGNPRWPGGAKMRSFSMAERDIEVFLSQPWCATSTDGWVVLPEEAVGVHKYINTNRRCFGSFPRRLGYYSQERKVDSLEEAVRKCSGLPAQILGIADRGRLAPGMKADVAVIDLTTLKDNTTFLEPNEYASGVIDVLVNGQAVVQGGRRTLALPGKVLVPAGRKLKSETAVASIKE